MFHCSTTSIYQFHRNHYCRSINCFVYSVSFDIEIRFSSIALNRFISMILIVIISSMKIIKYSEKWKTSRLKNFKWKHLIKESSENCIGESNPNSFEQNINKWNPSIKTFAEAWAILCIDCKTQNIFSLFHYYNSYRCWYAFSIEIQTPQESCWRAIIIRVGK